MHPMAYIGTLLQLGYVACSSAAVQQHIVLLRSVVANGPRPGTRVWYVVASRAAYEQS